MIIRVLYKFGSKYINGILTLLLCSNKKIRFLRILLYFLLIFPKVFPYHFNRFKKKEGKKKKMAIQSQLITIIQK
jgi:hypothetical protein